MTQDLTDDKLTLVQVMMATSHYLSQYWPSSDEQEVFRLIDITTMNFMAIAITTIICSEPIVIIKIDHNITVIFIN